MSRRRSTTSLSATVMSTMPSWMVRTGVWGEPVHEHIQGRTARRQSTVHNRDPRFRASTSRQPNRKCPCHTCCTLDESDVEPNHRLVMGALLSALAVAYGGALSQSESKHGG